MSSNPIPGVGHVIVDEVKETVDVDIVSSIPIAMDHTLPSEVLSKNKYVKLVVPGLGMSTGLITNIIGEWVQVNFNGGGLPAQFGTSAEQVWIHARAGFWQVTG